MLERILRSELTRYGILTIAMVVSNPVYAQTVPPQPDRPDYLTPNSDGKKGNVQAYYFDQAKKKEKKNESDRAERPLYLQDNSPASGYADPTPANSPTPQYIQPSPALDDASPQKGSKTLWWVGLVGGLAAVGVGLNSEITICDNGECKTDNSI